VTSRRHNLSDSSMKAAEEVDTAAAADSVSHTEVEAAGPVTTMELAAVDGPMADCVRAVKEDSAAAEEASDARRTETPIFIKRN